MSRTRTCLNAFAEVGLQCQGTTSQVDICNSQVLKYLIFNLIVQQYSRNVLNGMLTEFVISLALLFLE